MDDPNDTKGDAEAEVEADATNSMAYAAAEAAEAEEEEEDDLSQPCRLCGKGKDGRAMVRFHPLQVDPNFVHPDAATNTNIDTFLEDITLHVFCGKTASILPNVQMPQYEILSKAGIKNKHGIGPEVNAALARTRWANVAASGAKEKTFYLVHEFEANLLAIRTPHQDQQTFTFSPEIALQVPPSPHHPHHIYAPPDQYQYQMPAHEQQAQTDIKPSPIRAAAGAVHKPGRRLQASYMYPEPAQQYDTTAVTSEGKIRCACGGTHLPTGSSKGAASWRSHVMTKRHQKWMEDNGLIGAV